MSWPKATLDQISHSVDYGHTASADNNAVGPKFLRITDIQDGSVNWESVPRCECSAKDLNNNSLGVGDIVFARTGATTGKSFLLRSVPAECVFASYLIRVRPNESRVFPGYLARFFETQDYWGQISRNSSGTAQGGVNASKLKSLSVPLPPLPVQRRIAAILDMADALRAKRRVAITKCDQLLQSVFLDMFGDPVTNPKGWRTRTIGELATFITSGSRGWAKYYADDGAKFIRIQNLVKGDLDMSDCAYVNAPDSAEARRTSVEPGDVLVSITADLGRSAVVPEKLGKAHINQHIAILRLASISPIYASQYLAGPGGQIQFDRLNRAGVKAGLNFDDLRSLEIKIPPAELQARYIEIKSALDSQKDLLQNSAVQLEAEFSSLRQRAFSGQLNQAA